MRAHAVVGRVARCWLVKSEPDVYSIEYLERDGVTQWDGVRNYLARNLMRDQMKIGDRILFYHSNAKPPGVAGLARVAREGYPDPSAFDPKDSHFDAKSDPKRPTWMMVDVAYVETFPALVPSARLRDDPALAGMPLLQPFQRLSVQPVEARQFSRVVALGRARRQVASR